MKHKTVFLGAIVVVVLILIAFAIVWSLSQPGRDSANLPPANPTMPTAVTTSAVSSTATKVPVPANLTVPDAGAQSIPGNVAVPESQMSAGPSTTASYRSFSVNVSNQAFTPNTIIVKQNDVVNIEFTSVGGSYDFTQPDYGFDLMIPEGQTKKVQFSATSVGKFTFYCSSCGGPDKGPVGYIEVTP